MTDTTCIKRGGSCMVCLVCGCICSNWESKPIRGEKGSLAEDFVNIIQQVMGMKEVSV